MTIAANTMRKASATGPAHPNLNSPTGAPEQKAGAARTVQGSEGAGACRLVHCYGGLVQSRYNILIPIKGNGMLAFNAITASLTRWNSKGIHVYNNFATLLCAQDTKTIAAQLLAGGYLVRKGQDQYAAIKKQYEDHRFDPRSMTLSIAPTMSCNFGCDYCFQGERKARAIMKPEVQDALVAFVEKAIPRLNHLHTAWYGGEPMLRWQTIYKLADRFIDLCNANGIKYDAMMATNGYLLSQEKAERLYRRRVTTIQVTLDGPPEQHNRRRPLKSGGPSFDTIISNLKKIVGIIPITIAIRVNVDARNCDLAAMDRLFQTLEDSGLANRKGFAVYFAPVEAITRECSDIADQLLAKEEYARQELALYKLAIHRKVANHRYPPRFRGTCAAVRPNGYVVLPDGALHKCWDTVSSGENAVGTVFNPDKVAGNDVYQKWLRWSPFDIEACRKCLLLAVCAGACAYKTLHREDTRGDQTQIPCLSWKYTAKPYLLMTAIARKLITLDDVLPSDRQEICDLPDLAGSSAEKQAAGAT